MFGPFWVLFVLFCLSVFFVCFVQKGFGSQLSRQGAPEISQGSLKAGGQRPLTLPCHEREGRGLFPLLQTDLIKVNNNNNTPWIIKNKTPLSLSTHVIIQHCSDLHLLPDLPKCMETFNNEKIFILRHLFCLFTLLLFFFIIINNNRQ